MVMDNEKMKYIAASTDTIEEALSKIESNRHRSIIIVDDGKVVGTLSDGDIRKAILAKRLLSTPIREVMNINFLSLDKKKQHSAEKILIERDIFLIPIVDENLVLLDIVVK